MGFHQNADGALSFGYGQTYAKYDLLGREISIDVCQRVMQTSATPWPKARTDTISCAFPQQIFAVQTATQRTYGARRCD